MRFRYLRWGATDQEVGDSLPGDDLIPNADMIATRAITIRAAADRVLQLGFGEAVLPGSLEMAWELFGVAAADERGDRDQAAVTWREFPAFPDVAEEEVVGERDEFRCEVADQLLGARLVFAVGHRSGLLLGLDLELQDFAVVHRPVSVRH